VMENRKCHVYPVELRKGNADEYRRDH